MSADDSLPLTCQVLGGTIDMFIGTKTLRFAAERHPSVPGISITSLPEFAKAIVYQLNREDEIGTTPLQRLLDAAIVRAIESGCEGVEVPE